VPRRRPTPLRHPHPTGWSEPGSCPHGTDRGRLPASALEPGAPGTCRLLGKPHRPTGSCGVPLSSGRSHDQASGGHLTGRVVTAALVRPQRRSWRRDPACDADRPTSDAGCIDAPRSCRQLLISQIHACSRATETLWGRVPITSTDAAGGHRDHSRRFHVRVIWSTVLLTLAGLADITFAPFDLASSVPCSASGRASAMSTANTDQLRLGRPGGHRAERPWHHPLQPRSAEPPTGKPSWRCSTLASG
jgi:hypothetical protein